MVWEHQVDVLVTFDHDADSAFRQSASALQRGPSYLSAGVFGPRVGMRRVLDLLARRGIQATFFVPGWVGEHWPDSVLAAVDEGHEIGLHGYLHEYPARMVDPAEERMVVARGIDALAGVVGPDIHGYRPPGSAYSESTIGLLREFGFLYGSAMQDDDGAYVHASSSERPLVEIPCPWHLCDDIFGWHGDIRMAPSQVEETWLGELNAMGAYPNRLFVLTLHPHQIAHPGRLAMLDRVLARAEELGARFRTCADVAREAIRVMKP